MEGQKLTIPDLSQDPDVYRQAANGAPGPVVLPVKKLLIAGAVSVLLAGLAGGGTYYFEIIRPQQIAAATLQDVTAKLAIMDQEDAEKHAAKEAERQAIKDKMEAEYAALSATLRTGDLTYEERTTLNQKAADLKSEATRNLRVWEDEDKLSYDHPKRLELEYERDQAQALLDSLKTQGDI